MEPHSTPSVVRILSDSSRLEPSDDRAKRYALAKRVASRIISIDNVSVYSINGAWGSGKSVFMHWLYEELYAHKEIIPFYFSAWKYESLGNLVQPLLATMKSVEKLDPSGKKDIDKLVIAAGIALASTSVGIDLKTLNTNFKEARKCLQKNRKLDEMNDVVQLRIDYIEKFETDFISAISEILKRREGARKIVFLVDELDRCSPASVVTLLESIKNFLQVDRTCFVFAVDKRVLSDAIKVKYGNLLEVDGDEYLQKVIQFSYELPFNASIVVPSLLKDYEKNSEAMRVNLEFASRIFELADTKSLRTIKKVLNRYVLFYEGCYEQVKGGFDPQLVFLLAFIYEVYPEVYRLMKEYPQLTLDTIQGVTVERFNKRERESLPNQKLTTAVYQTKLAAIVAQFKVIAKGKAEETLGKEGNKALQLLQELGA